MDELDCDYTQEYLELIEKAIDKAKFTRTASPSMFPVVRPTGIGESQLRQLYAEWIRVKAFQDAMRRKSSLFIS